MAHRPPVRFADDRDPWDRQPGESHKQHSRLLFFRDLGPARTLKQAAENLAATGDSGATYTAIRAAAHSYRWTERVDAWDREQTRLADLRRQQQRREMIERQLRAGRAMQDLGMRRFATLDPNDLSARDAAYLLDTGAAIERAALADQPMHLTVATGPTTVIGDISHLSGAERMARLADIAAELQRRAGARDDRDDD